MKVEFTRPVAFSTLSFAFTGEGIPAIPADAMRRAVSSHTTAYVAANGEAWEKFNGRGTTEASETYYWPTLAMCPRRWAQDEAGKGAVAA